MQITLQLGIIESYEEKSILLINGRRREDVFYFGFE